MYARVPTINPLSKTNIAFEIEGAGVSPVSALEQLYKEVILPRLCAACGACVGNCPYLVKFRGRTVKLDSCSRAEGRCYVYCPPQTSIRNPSRRQFFLNPMIRRDWAHLLKQELRGPLRTKY